MELAIKSWNGWKGTANNSACGKDVVVLLTFLSGADDGNQVVSSMEGYTEQFEQWKRSGDPPDFFE